MATLLLYLNKVEFCKCRDLYISFQSLNKICSNTQQLKIWVLIGIWTKKILFPNTKSIEGAFKKTKKVFFKL